MVSTFLMAIRLTSVNIILLMRVKIQGYCLQITFLSLDRIIYVASTATLSHITGQLPHGLVYS